MNKLEQLKKENAELLASNQCIRESVDVINAIGDELRFLYRDLLGGEDISGDLYGAKERIENLCRLSLNRTPSQHLADIKADAVDSVLDNCALFHNREFVRCDDIIKYAEKLRGES